MKVLAILSVIIVASWYAVQGWTDVFPLLWVIAVWVAAFDD